MLGARRAGSRKSRQIKPLFHHHGVSMDSLHAIGFYVSSGVALVGGLGVALLPSRGLRGAGIAVVGLGLAGIYLALSAGFAAAVSLVCFSGCRPLFSPPPAPPAAAVVRAPPG